MTFFWYSPTFRGYSNKCGASSVSPGVDIRIATKAELRSSVSVQQRRVTVLAQSIGLSSFLVFVRHFLSIVFACMIARLCLSIANFPHVSSTTAESSSSRSTAGALIVMPRSC